MNIHPLLKNISVKVGRYDVVFSDHAIEQWVRRRHPSSGDPRKRLLEDVAGTRIQIDPPNWARLSTFNRARAHGYIITSDGCFVVNRRGVGRDRVAVTFLAP